MDEGYFAHIVEHPEISARDVELIKRHQPNARRVVDIGCGRGGFVEICRQQIGAGLGLDNEPAAAHICRADGIPFVLGDAQRLPFARDSMDVVRAKEIIEHLPDPRRMLRDIMSVLRPGGLLIAHVPSQFSALYPAGNFWDDYTHVRPLSRLGLRRLLEDTGFEVEVIGGYTAGRNSIEKAAGRLLALVVPHTWLAAARKRRL
jgi:SAM-dependent methyltransferase